MFRAVKPQLASDSRQQEIQTPSVKLFIPRTPSSNEISRETRFHVARPFDDTANTAKIVVHSVIWRDLEICEVHGPVRESDLDAFRSRSAASCLNGGISSSSRLCLKDVERMKMLSATHTAKKSLRWSGYRRNRRWRNHAEDPPRRSTPLAVVTAPVDADHFVHYRRYTGQS